MTHRVVQFLHSVWTILGQHLLFVCSRKTGKRRIIRLEELLVAFTVNRSRYTGYSIQTHKKIISFIGCKSKNFLIFNGLTVSYYFFFFFTFDNGSRDGEYYGQMNDHEANSEGDKMNFLPTRRPLTVQSKSILKDQFAIIGTVLQI